MDVYNNPEKFDLEIIGTLDEMLSYAFNTLVVFRNKKGELFYTSDSGCSCPSPFEGFGLNELEKISIENFESFKTVVKYFPVNIDDQNMLLAKVENLL